MHSLNGFKLNGFKLSGFKLNGFKTDTLALILTALLVVLNGCDDRAGAEAEASAGDSTKVERVVALGGTVTEIVYALGAADRLVGVDVSSTWPEQATRLPQVGYQRTLSAENILSLEPTLIIESDEAGPPAAIEQLRAAGVEVVLVPSSEHSLDGVKGKIATIAQALSLGDAGSKLIDSVERGMSTMSPASAEASKAPGVMFLYSRGQGSVQVSGSGTSADAMISLAGGRNVVDGYSGYKALTAESALAANPEVILVPKGALDALGGIDGLLKQPGLAGTQAGKNRRIVAMDDLYLLGFGPRTAAAIADLRDSIFAEATQAGL